MTWIKDPDSVLDYGIDWSAWLDDDTITASVWVDVTDGITVADDSFTDTTTRVWLSGGTHRTTYRLTNRITTAGGRTDDRTVSIDCRDR